jgi:hypothetical protein
MDVDEAEAHAHEPMGFDQTDDLVLAGNACPGQVVQAA